MKWTFCLLFILFLTSCGKNSRIVYSEEEVDVKPEYLYDKILTLSSFYKQINYPPEARDQQIEGTVEVSYIVEKDGSMSNASIFKSAHPLLDQEVMRVIYDLQCCRPATINGKAVRCEVIFPIKFSLE